MIGDTLSMGNIINIVTVAGTIMFTSGNYSGKVETIEKDQDKVVKRVKKVEEDVTDLKVTTAKIETKIDERFDRIEEILMDK